MSEETLKKVSTKDIMDALMSSEHNLPTEIVTEIMKRVSTPSSFNDEVELKEIPHNPKGKDLVEMFLYKTEDEFREIMSKMDGALHRAKSNSELIKIYYKEFSKRDLSAYCAFLKTSEMRSDPFGGLLGALISGHMKKRRGRKEEEEE